jgi:hypothetical protein
MARWAKLIGIIVAVVVLLFVTLRLIGVGGEHGPGRHDGDPASPGSHTPPIGGHR